MNQPVAPTYVLPAPVSKEEFLSRLPELYLVQLRQMTLLAPYQQVAALLPKSDHQEEFLTPELLAEQLGLTAGTLPDRNLFDTLSRMYDFAYQGVRYEGTAPMGSNSDYTWAAALVLDIQSSFVATLWSDFGAEDAPSTAKLCVQVAETANARAVLEGEEGFLSLGRSTDEDGWYVGEGLTIRQMALLAGMEESSIRTAANPRKPNALKTYHDEKGRTRIAPDVAKTWLTAKGRYVVPRTVLGDVAPLDLTKRGFSSMHEIIEGIRQAARYACVGKDHGERERLTIRLKTFGLTQDDEGFWSVYLQQEDLADEIRMRALAEGLDLAPDLFVLRVRQGLAAQALRAVTSEIEASLVARPQH